LVEVDPIRLKSIELSYRIRLDRTVSHCNRVDRIGCIDRLSSIRFDRTPLQSSRSNRFYRLVEVDRTRPIRSSSTEFVYQVRFDRIGFQGNRFDRNGFTDWLNPIDFDPTRSNVISRFESIELVSIAITSIETVLAIGRIRFNSIECDYPSRFDRIGFQCNRFDRIGFLTWSRSIEFDPNRASSI